jgi:hypothetical protein
MIDGSLEQNPEADEQDAYVPARDAADWLNEAAYNRLRRFESAQEVRDFLKAAGILESVLVEEDTVEGRRWFSAAPARSAGVQVDILYAEEGQTRYRSSDRGETARVFAAMAAALRHTNVLV